MIIGIPRSLFYYKYGTIIRTFFNELDIQYIISDPSTVKTLENGKMLAPSEACTSLKMFLGHVENLKDKCDFIFVPRIESVKKDEKVCTNFYLLPDLVRNLFNDQHIIDFNVNVNNGKTMKGAFISLGLFLGFSYNKTLNAYKRACDKDKKVHNNLLLKQNNLLNKNNKKILIVGHPYNVYDEIIGNPVIDILKKYGFSIIYADISDNYEDNKLSSSIYFSYNKELIRGINLYKDYVNGIILLSTFPCGPDSIVNELIMRNINDMPLLNLIIDDVNSITGIITRLESFIDIVNKEDIYEK